MGGRKGSSRLDRHGSLLRAQVLGRLEPREVAVRRIGLAIERTEREIQQGDRHRKSQLKNLRQVESWLKYPNFLDDPKNWPSRTL